MRRVYPELRLILVLPCPEQAQGWNPKDRERYETIKGKADKMVYTSPRYHRGCMFKRNRRLVEHSSVCVCYLTKPAGGTFYTVKYAHRQGLKILNLADSDENPPLSGKMQPHPGAGPFPSHPSGIST